MSRRLAVAGAAPVIVANALGIAWILIFIGRTSPFSGVFGLAGFWVGLALWLADAWFGVVALRIGVVPRWIGLALAVGSLLGIIGMGRLELTSSQHPTVFGPISLIGLALNAIAWVALGVVILRPGRRAVAGVVAALLVAGAVAACAPAPSPFVPPASVRPVPAPGADGARLPVIVDTDLDADDLLALMALVQDPAVEVRAIAIAGTGLVHCTPGLVTMGRLLVALEAASIRVACGREDPGPDGRAFPEEWRTAADDAYGLATSLPPEPGVAYPAPGAAAVADLYRDVVEGAGDAAVSVVALGPWTNLEDAFAADPTLVSRVRVIHAMLGTIDAPGNVELGPVDPGDGVEWNAAADPSSLATVLGLDVPVSLVPLDATDDVPVPPDVATMLGLRQGSAAVLVARELYDRTPSLAAPGRFWWDPLAALSFTAQALVEWEDLRVTVDTGGDSAGRLRRVDAGRPVRAAMRADPDAVTAALLGALERGSDRPLPEGWTVVPGVADLRLALPAWLVPFDTTGAVFANEPTAGVEGLQLLAEGGRTAVPQPGAAPLERWLAASLESPVAGRPIVEAVLLDAGPGVSLRRVDGVGTPGSWRIAAWAIRTPVGTVRLVVDGPVAAWTGREEDVERIARLLRAGPER